MNKPMLFIDTEFNGFNGKLMSMAIVGEFEGFVHEFYEVVQRDEDMLCDSWVIENVMPVLNKEPIKYQDLQESLRIFLHRFSEGFVIVADWPDDIKHFCEALITGPGTMFNIPSFEMKVELMKSLSTANLSKVPHNALADARALRRELLERHEYRLY